MLNHKIETLLVWGLIIVAVVKSEDKNLSAEDRKDVKRIVKDYLNIKNGEQLMSGRFGKRVTDEDIDNEIESEYENEYEDELENFANGREDAAQWFNGRFGREIGGRILPRFATESNKPHLRGRFGRAAKM
ncbi:pol-RFamide neuropeptides [Hydra vulgaris]|uniref:Pol-RFamide neuropeptides n=1 Tax=Hydra vulgaris TaxID=6087 RepID=A0ABM4CJV9_HYDVU